MMKTNVYKSCVNDVFQRYVPSELQTKDVANCK